MFLFFSLQFAQFFFALALDLVKRLLVVDPKARFTTEEALGHPWLQVGVGWWVWSGAPLY